MKGSLRLGRIAGIEIGIHYTWLLAFALIAWSLAAGFFPGAAPRQTLGAYWIAGVISALLLFVSVLLHELAHSLVAQARGIPVRSITLFIFGGVSNLEEEAERPAVEFAMAIVGPLTSLVLALIFWIIFQAMQPAVSLASFFRIGGWLPQENIVAASLFYLALINALLAAFNILPGFPLDGGRVLRSILWGASGNLVRATNIAATVGRLFGWGFIAWGVFQVLFAGDWLGGLWIAFIGWFLSNAADASRQEVTLKEHLTGARVKDVMYVGQESISPKTMVADVVHGIFQQRFRRAVPVCQDNRPVGIVTITDLKGLPQEKWAQTPVEQIMTREPLYSVTPEDDLNAAMKLITQHDLNQVLVLSQGQCVGLLSRADIIRYLQLSQELRMKSGLKAKQS
ncbi:MAG: site-2 protease family protein [Dehalococcoidales bacterium]|nr:site-2 protease family protein [Dehalococcoidales bacterium]